MSRESNDGFVCPTCEETIYREQCACDPPPCQHERRSINLSTAFLECRDCGEQLLDCNRFISSGKLKVQR